jgi:hypothetical protein
MIRISFKYLKYPIILCFVSKLYISLCSRLCRYVSAIIADVGAPIAKPMFCS